MATKVGKITHYYDHIGVAIVKLSKTLKVGDKIKISGHNNEFIQNVNSLQFDHKSIKSAKTGSSVGLKVDNPVKDNDIVFKMD